MFTLPSPIQKISHPHLEAHDIHLWIKRDDLIHPEVSGNKWRKLKYNLEEAAHLGKKEIVTLGGAFSNHIAATAAACHSLGFVSIGLIRGDELNEESNPTLQRAAELGMKLVFTERSRYRKISQQPETLQESYPNSFVIPEGGANGLGMKGVQDIIAEIQINYQWVITPIGTGTTFQGLLQANSYGNTLGISVLKGINELTKLRHLATPVPTNGYEINSAFHFGGYAKTTPELIDFINQMKDEIKIQFDPVYTGKAFFGVWKMIADGKFDGQTLVFLHTGGLQGIAGFNQKSPQKIYIY